MNSQDSTAGQICITLDLDWAKDEILQTALTMMREAAVKATFFATHKSDLLGNLEGEQFEVGLHPNFNQSSGEFFGPTENLKALYPQAKGGRSHSLFVSSRILQRYLENGLVYESNLFLPLHEHLHPVVRIKGLVSIPLYWCDDVHFYLSDSFKLEDLRLETPGLKVLTFHPIHVFMNTVDEAHYARYKGHYQDPAKLEDFVNRKNAGVRSLFQSLLEYLSRNQTPTYTLSQIYEEYLSRNQLPG